MSGILSFIAGLAIERAHNRWAADWLVLVSLFGWLAVIGGLVRMVFPIQLAATVVGVGRSTGVVAVALLVVGAFLSSKVYCRE